MNRHERYVQDRIETEKRARRAELEMRVLAVLFVALVFAAFLALGLWVRHSAPCWVFPLAEAPVRCLPHR